MKNYLSKNLLFTSLLLIIICGIALSLPSVSQAGLANDLAGRILLQVEARGEAWYVNPLDTKRYFLGRPADAFNVMRQLGLGVSNKDFNSFGTRAPSRLSGRILLKVEDAGQAYYVNPIDLKMHYLGRPTDAFNIMRQLGLGITNENLFKIIVAYNFGSSSSTAVPGSSSGTVVGNSHFSWKYQGQTYTIDLDLNNSLYQDYRSSSKVFSYYGQLPDDWREKYYGMFLAPRNGDGTINIITSQLKTLANKRSLNDDQLAELTISFVQSIPYDKSKDLKNGKPNYYYELLYNNLGVCSEKTFFGVMLLRNLGFGAAILDYDDVSHTAIGIACPAEYDVYDSGYCYAETTNSFPIGVTPQSIGDAVVTNTDLSTYQGQFDNIFRVEQLGPVEILQKTTGKVYQGIKETYVLVDKIKRLEKLSVESKPVLETSKQEVDQALTKLEALASQLAVYKNAGQTEAYNALVPSYNQALEQYNASFKNYQLQIELYNSNIADYNNYVTNFYQ